MREYSFSFLSSLSLGEKKELAIELRKEIVDAVRRHGGHLSSNLGVVESTISLLSVFNLDRDKILFDVGHQTYAYKLLTGRDIVKDLREYKGTAPFSLRSESKYDFYDNGHSGDSIPTAIGMAVSKDDDSTIICFVGDASLDNGLAHEGLDFLTQRKDLKNLIVVVNTNSMAIHHRSDDRSIRLENDERDYDDFRKSKLAEAMIDENIWEDYVSLRRNFNKEINRFTIAGLNYIGLVDGHDFIDLENSFKKAKKVSKNGVCVVEILTKKGYGIKDCEEDRNGKFHGVPRLNYVKNKTFSDVKAELISSKMEDKDLYLISPAMEDNSGLTSIFEKYPSRTIDVGIAEENAIVIASGISLNKKKAIVDIYSTFLQRAVDEVIENISRQRLPLLTFLERASLVGEDGASHHGIYDVALLKAIPNVKVYMPIDKATLNYVYDLHDFNGNTPTFIRLPKEECEKIEIGSYMLENSHLRLCTRKNNILALSIGPMGYKALKQIDCDVDKTILLDLLPNDIRFMLKYDEIRFYDPYCTKEGTCSYLRDELMNLGYKGRFSYLTLPKDFVSFGSIEDLHKECKTSIEDAIHFFKFGLDN